MKISAATRATILRLAQEGMAGSAIVAKTGASMTSVLRTAALAAFPTLAGGGPGHPRSLDHEAIKLAHAGGMSAPEIASTYGCSKASVVRIVYPAGAPRHQRSV